MFANDMPEKQARQHQTMQPLLQPTALSMLLSLSESQLDSSVEQGADIVQ